MMHFLTLVKSLPSDNTSRSTNITHVEQGLTKQCIRQWVRKSSESTGKSEHCRCHRLSGSWQAVGSGLLACTCLRAVCLSLKMSANEGRCVYNYTNVSGPSRGIQCTFESARQPKNVVAIFVLVESLLWS